jgi:hypothetical protein
VKVYVLESGVYSDRFVDGVFATPELAMAAHGKGVWTKDTYLHDDGTEAISWSNGLDWGDAGYIAEYEVRQAETG